jgi:hypothetical protein
MIKKILLTLTAVVLLILNSCGESGVEPELQPGRRDYVWTADTLKIPVTYLEKIWGDSPDNVWAVGPGGRLSTTIWKYDGNKWATDNISRGISPHGVWGFGKNNVWACGNEGRIWNYNGTEWKQSIWFTKQNWDIGFQEIWGDAPNSIYAVGFADSSSVRRAEIIKWDGSTWQGIKIPDFDTYGFIKIRRAANQQGNYFLLGWGEKSNGGDLLALFEFDGKNIWKIYEGDFNNQSWSNVESIGDEIFFMIGNKICTYENNQFRTIIEINNFNYNQGFFGRNEKDIIIPMMDGIAQYNGTDIQYIYHYKGTEETFSSTVLSNDIFILTNDFNNNTNIIIRGKLQ